VLRQLYQLHPEIANDPVYAAALRMFRVGVGTDIDHHRMHVENCAEVDAICRKILGDDPRRGGGGGSGPARHGRKRAAPEGGGEGGEASGGGGGGGKKRKKGRPPKNSSSGDKLTKGTSAAEAAPAVRANASWT
jgi:uncharacterized membrane protein YgcG